MKQELKWEENLSQIETPYVLVYSEDIEGCKFHIMPTELASKVAPGAKFAELKDPK